MSYNSSVVAIIALFFSMMVAMSYIGNKTPANNSSPNRIAIVSDTVINQHGYLIIEVDSVEYICSPNGICPLVKK